MSFFKNNNKRYLFALFLLFGNLHSGIVKSKPVAPAPNSLIQTSAAPASANQNAKILRNTAKIVTTSAMLGKLFFTARKTLYNARSFLQENPDSLKILAITLSGGIIGATIYYIYNKHGQNKIKNSPYVLILPPETSIQSSSSNDHRFAHYPNPHSLRSIQSIDHSSNQNNSDCTQNIIYTELINPDFLIDNNEQLNSSLLEGIEEITIESPKDGPAKVNDTENLLQLEFGGRLPLAIIDLIRKINKPASTLAQKRLIPHCILLYGPPGTGKTTLAQVIAQETDSIFMELPAPSIGDRYVNSGQRDLYDFFENVKAQALTVKSIVILIDEIDGISSIRDNHNNNQAINVCNALLDILNKIKKTNNIYVIAATNRFNALDSAILRRFKKVKIDLPDLEERLFILQHHARNQEILFEDNIIELTAKSTSGLSGSDLRDIIEEATATALSEAEELLLANPLVKGKHVNASLLLYKQYLMEKADDPTQEKPLSWTEMINAIANATSTCSQVLTLINLFNNEDFQAQMQEKQLLSLKAQNFLNIFQIPLSSNNFQATFKKSGFTPEELEQIQIQQRELIESLIKEGKS